MPRATWKPDEALTPFARLVRAWMWRQSPPMTVPQLADLSGVSKQAIWGWFQHESLPRRDTVIQLARRTGLDVDELLRAAGLADTRMADVERRGAERVYRGMLARLERGLRADARLSATDADTVMTYLRRLTPEMVELAVAALRTGGEGEPGGEGAVALLLPPAETPAETPDETPDAEEPAPKRRRARALTSR